MKTKDFLGNAWDITCMGCSIADGSMDVPGGFIAQTPHFIVHQDPLIPLAQRSNITASEWASIRSTISAIRKLLS